MATPARPPRRSRAPSADSRAGRRTRRETSRSPAAVRSAPYVPPAGKKDWVERVFATRVESPPDGVKCRENEKGPPVGDPSIECAGEDLNLHGVAPTSPSS